MEIEKHPASNSYYWIVEDDRKTKIIPNYFTAKAGRCRNIEEGDKLVLKGGPKDLRITIKIIPGYYLNHR